MKTQLSAIDCTLAGLFDYAGMFPPAGQDLRAAVRDYLAYRSGPHACALGRLVIHEKASSTLRNELPEEVCNLRLSVTSTAMNPDAIQQYIDEGLLIETIEVKTEDRNEILRWKENLPAGIATYVEVPVSSGESDLLTAISEAGMLAKLRMGGVVGDAFPSTVSVAVMLKTLAQKKIPFKATAGLHHPLRSLHPFTYQKESQVGMMHGFMNLLCAAALVWFGGEAKEAEQLLEEGGPHAWHVATTAIRWRSWIWSTNQLQEVREQFLMSIGSCSFSEPINDLEALGWL
jgi:hypothetical protein